jgi:hypothetical protein
VKRKPLTISIFKDIIKVKLLGMIYQLNYMIRLGHESVTGRDGYSDFYKKDLTVNVLGPVGDKVEEWTLKGAFITSADFGELDWSDSGEAMTINLTLSVDYCILQY